jgi:hypothetical protein
MAQARKEPPRYTTDAELAYARVRWWLTPGAPLRFDEAYRMAHLPLVAPDHPAAIHEPAGRPYRSGRCSEVRYSLVVPIEAAALVESAVFAAIERDVASQAFAHKIAWSLLPLRATKLHITLAGGLERTALAQHAEAARRVLREHGPLRYRLGGLFCGEKNHGRLYFAGYPERIGNADVFALVQDAVRGRRSALYLFGYYNLLDELDPTEAQALYELLERWREATTAELEAASLQLIATHDDLALEGHVIEHVSSEPRIAGGGF